MAVTAPSPPSAVRAGCGPADLGRGRPMWLPDATRLYRIRGGRRSPAAGQVALEEAGAAPWADRRPRGRDADGTRTVQCQWFLDLPSARGMRRGAWAGEEDWARAAHGMPPPGGRPDEGGAAPRPSAGGPLRPRRGSRPRRTGPRPCVGGNQQDRPRPAGGAAGCLCRGAGDAGGEGGLPGGERPERLPQGLISVLRSPEDGAIIRE
jgi:hypothetical protein